MSQNGAVKKRTILIICRGLSEVSLLSQLKPEPQYCYVIASDDIRVQELVKQYPWVDDVCWTEKMESLYEVASDVITILEGVNLWLKSLSNDRFGMARDLLFWIRHAEGGVTTQRIQDALLLIRSYLRLLEAYNVERIVLLYGSSPTWEDGVLIQTARSRGICIQEISFFDQKKSLKYRTKFLIQSIGAYFKLAVRAPHHVYRVCKIIQVRYRQHSNFTVNANGQDEIVFQLCSSADNHVEDIVPLMKTLQQKGYKPVALCWGAGQGAEKVRKEGLHAEELEGFIPEWVPLEVPYRIFYTRIKANRKIKQFLNLPELKYQSVALGPLLLPSIQHFLSSELAKWYKLDRALKEYFMYHNPVAIKLWGGVSLAEGFIAWKNLNWAKRPLIFDYWLGIGIEWPYYQPKQDPTDLFLAVGPIQRRLYLERYGFCSGSIVMVGKGRYEHLRDWMKTYNGEMSRSYLNIPPGYVFHIFYDPTFLPKGFLTIHEQVLIANTLLTFVKGHSSVALIIKPHPIHQPGILEHMIEHYSLPNVFLIEKSMLPYHVLNAVDLVIIKLSTIGLEAMLFGKPVISCILDGEERWKYVYEDAVEYVQTVDSLRRLLEELVEDAEFRSRWTEIRLEKQKQFLKQYFGEHSQPPTMLAAEAIASRLKGVSVPP